jgi:holo-[acyl-carrier protein] synthase
MNDKVLASGQGIGIDITPVARFVAFEGDKENPFLRKVFSTDERDYCFSYKNPSVHLAGFFALKEAVSKALGTSLYPFAEIEIRHTTEGAPEAWFSGKKLAVRTSISHTDELAIAIAVV